MASREHSDVDPFTAAGELQDLLREAQRALPAWRRFPDDWDEWTPEQRTERVRSPDMWSICTARNTPGVFMVTWEAGQLLGEHVSPKPSTVAGTQPPMGIPERVRHKLESGWRDYCAHGASGPFEYVRNQWAERRVASEPYREKIGALAGLAVEAIHRVNGDPACITALDEDEFLHSDTISNAIQALQQITDDGSDLRARSPGSAHRPAALPDGRSEPALRGEEGPRQVESRAQETEWKAHIAAALSEEPGDFLRLMRTDGVSLGKLRYSLSGEGRAILDKVLSYYHRWQAEGGPHPDYARLRNAELDAEFRRDPLGFGIDRTGEVEPEHNRWRELPAWDAPEIRTLRGEWVGVLEEAFRALQNLEAVRSERNPPIQATPARSAAELRRHEDGDDRNEIDTVVRDREPGVDEPALVESRDESPQDENQLFFRGTSETAVTAIVRAVDELRTDWPDLVPKKTQIKEKAGKHGGAGDRAIKRCLEHKLITPDHRLTDAGRAFLDARR